MKTRKEFELTALLSLVFGSTAVSLLKDPYLKPKHTILMLGIAVAIVATIGFIASFILFGLAASPLMLIIATVLSIVAPLIFVVGMAVAVHHDELTSLLGHLLDYLSTGIKDLIHSVRQLNLTSPENSKTIISACAVALILFGGGLLLAGLMISSTSIAAIITSLSLICGGFVIIAIGGRLFENPEWVGETWNSLPSMPSISSYFKAGDTLGAELSLNTRLDTGLGTGLVMESLDRTIFEIGSDSDKEDESVKDNPTDVERTTSVTP